MANPHRYRLTVPARRDLSEIARYTGRMWGVKQQRTYLSGLYRLFEQIAASAGWGRPVEAIGKAVRVRDYQRSHRVYYRVDKSHVIILRVLHVRQDPRRAFRNPG